jgi:hypothetical protein
VCGMSATRLAIADDAAAQPRTFRLTQPASREAAYRRLAISILGLDVPTLAAELRATRLASEDRTAQPGGDLRRAA